MIATGLIRLRTLLAGLLSSFGERPRRYEPSKHYMRGPGPKSAAASMSRENAGHASCDAKPQRFSGA
jgi:hypothetical protein